SLRSARFVRKCSAMRFDPNHIAPPSHRAIFDVNLPAGDRPLELLLNRLPVGGMNHLDEAAVGRGLAPWHAVHGPHSIVEREFGRRNDVFPYANLSGPGGQANPLFAEPEKAVHSLLLGDVAHHTRKTCRLTELVINGVADHVRKERQTVLALEPAPI